MLISIHVVSQIWEFRHPSFKADMQDMLEQIKRKIPTSRKPSSGPTTNGSTKGAAKGKNAAAKAVAVPQQEAPVPQIQPMQDHLHIDLQRQLANLAQDQQNLIAHVNSLSRDYQGMLAKIGNLERNFSIQDSVAQQMIQYMFDTERKWSKMQPNASMHEDSSYSASSELQQLISTYQEVSRNTFDHLDDIPRRSSVFAGRLLNPPRSSIDANFPSPQNSGTPNSTNQGNLLGSDTEKSPFHMPVPINPRPNSRSSLHNILSPDHQRYQSSERSTADHHFANLQSQSGPSASTSQQPPPQSAYSRQPNPPDFSDPIQQPTGIALPARPGPPRTDSDGNPFPSPGWAVAPKVLVVEDDAVCRKLSSKFLQVFGCQIDVAEDGVSAVNKMNMEKYDLVFMDIGLPHLDGQSI